MNDSVINKSDESKFLNLIKNNIKKNDIVILLDYGHGLISKKVLKFVTKNSKFLCINKQLNSFNKNKYKLDQLIEADLFSILNIFFAISNFLPNKRESSCKIKILSKGKFDL